MPPVEDSMPGTSRSVGTIGRAHIISLSQWVTATRMRGTGNGDVAREASIYGACKEEGVMQKASRTVGTTWQIHHPIQPNAKTERMEDVWQAR